MNRYGKPSKIYLVYPINIRFPMERANSIQIINTCRSIAGCGIKVCLLLKKVNDLTETQMLDFYGLSPHKNLTVSRIPIPFLKSTARNKAFFGLALIYITFLLILRRANVFLVRDHALVPYLNKLKKFFRFKIMYEIHGISYLVAENQHTLFPNTKPASKTQIERLKQKDQYVLNSVDKVLTITDGLSRCIQQKFGVPEEKIFMVPDGFNSSAYTGDLSDIKKGIIYTGQLYPWKGVDTLIEAMRYLNTNLTVVGGLPYEDDLKRLKDKVAELKLTDKITFTGFLRPVQVALRLKAARISIIPITDNILAREYTSPLKLFEAMGAKTAVIASDLPSIREIIRNRGNGILFKPGDPKSLAESIKLLLEDEQLYKCIIAKAYEESKNYTWDKRAEKIVEAYKSIISSA